MSENYLDDLFDQLVTVEPHPAWNDVLARARRSRRRYGALVAAVAVYVLDPTVWAIYFAFTAPPPPQVQTAAATWTKILPQMLPAAAGSLHPHRRRPGGSLEAARVGTGPDTGRSP